MGALTKTFLQNFPMTMPCYAGLEDLDSEDLQGIASLALTVRTSIEVKLCYWGSDTFSVFFDIMVNILRSSSVDGR